MLAVIIVVVILLIANEDNEPHDWNIISHGHTIVSNKAGTQTNISTSKTYKKKKNTSMKDYSHIAYYTPSLHWGPTGCIGQGR